MEKRITTLGKKSFSEGEKWSDYDVNIISQPKREGAGRINVAIDMGSTYTRTRRFNTEQMTIGEEKELNSDILKVSDISNINSKNATLHSNMEFEISDITEPSIKPDKIFTKEHFVKGALMTEVTGVPMTRPSKVSKTRLLSTYLNALTAVATEIIFSYQNKKLDKGCFHVGIAMALPPEDFYNIKTLDDFKNNLAGHYTVKLPRLDITLNIKISADEIYLEKEPNAVLYSLANDNEDLLEVTSIGLDGGGKTNDIAFSYEGRLNDDVALTGEFGGNKLVDNITRSYCKKTGSSKPTYQAIEHALGNGILVRAGREEDISEYIKEEKYKIAQLIFNDLSSVADNADISLEDVEYITFHGRLYRDTKLSDGTVLSIKNMIMDLIASTVGASNAPKSIVVSDNSIITKGVVLSLWVNQ